MNVRALTNLALHFEKALTKDLAVPFQKMAMAFLQNLIAMPKASPKAKDGTMIHSLRTVVTEYVNHELVEIAARAQTLLAGASFDKFFVKVF